MRETTHPIQSPNRKERERHSEQRKEGNSKPLDESSGSKGGKGKKGKTKCGYCNHDYHPESSCMKKTIDLMADTSTEQSWGLHSRECQEEVGRPSTRKMR
jgi:hypothetical protein